METLRSGARSTLAASTTRQRLRPVPSHVAAIGHWARPPAHAWGVAPPVRSAAQHAPRHVCSAVAVDSAQSDKHLALYDVDPDLRRFKDHLDYRWSRYQAARQEILGSGFESIADFAKGYEQLGFTRQGGATVYREWAPAATAAALIGDFSGWQPVWMEKGEFGVWSVTLPDGPDGPAIPHGSRVKVRLQTFQGWWADRVPAWIKYATIPAGEMGAKYNGVYWDPPKGEKHEWVHPRPAKPRGLRIYEAHVGMGGEAEKVSTYREFIEAVLPRIKAQGYNAIQLMAIQEHAYYASFGYHVTNPFAVSSRSGTPEDLKALVDAAHGLGLLVLLDVVHSHISKNQDDGLAGFDFGQGADCSYFREGEAGYHRAWDSRVLNYGHYEVKRYLLSNLRYWIDEFKFDGFRFDGVTSMLYQHHGIGVGFSGNYAEYFGPQADVEACVYLMLANEMLHGMTPQALSIAEDVSGMPGLCRPVSEGGLGFDMRLGMAIPDKWIEMLKHVRDEHWSMMDIVTALCNRRYSEKTVAYAESHDQALVGDKTIAMWLMDAEMYTGMSTLGEATPVISRGIAMHKLIRMVTMALGGEAWLNFMGNEFGHPEWLDFPREGNNWSHFYCRRQWSLADADHLRYRHLLEWDKAMNQLDDTTGFLADPWQWVTHIDQGRQVLVAERGPVVFVFNFSPHTDHEGLKVATPEPGKWRVIIDSDDPRFGGQGRVGHDTDHFTSPAAEAGEAELKEGRFHDRDQFMQVLAPARTVVGYTRVKEEQEEAFIAAAANAGTVSPSDDDDGTSSAAAAAATAATAAPAAGPGAPAAAPHAPAAPAAAPEAPAAVTAPAANAQLPAGWGPAAAAPAAAPPAAVKAAPAAAPGPAAAPAPAQPAEGPSVEPEDPPSSSRPPSPVKLAKVVEKSEFVIYSFDDADHHNQVDDLSG